MTAHIVRPEVARFVAAVRAALDDLTPEEVDELTGGLEADLSDTVDVSGADGLGDPAAYAAELRSAAGLPPRGGARRPRPGLLDTARDNLRHHLDRLDAQPWWPSVRDFLVVLRPAWWVLRAWVAVTLLVATFVSGGGGVVPRSFLGFVLLVAAVVVSVQLGRGAFPASDRLAGLVVLGNGLAILLLPLALDQAAQPPVYTSSDITPVDGTSDSGLYSRGQPVQNVYAYDEQGRLLPAVQLYDQDGRPLDVDQGEHDQTSDADGVQTTMLPATNADGRELWNVYPLRKQALPATAADGSTPAPTAPPTTPPPPFRAIAPVVTPTPSPAASGAPSGAVPQPAPTSSTATTPSTPTPPPSPSASAARPVPTPTASRR